MKAIVYVDISTNAIIYSSYSSSTLALLKNSFFRKITTDRLKSILSRFCTVALQYGTGPSTVPYQSRKFAFVDRVINKKSFHLFTRCTLPELYVRYVYANIFFDLKEKEYFI